jgi:hypothetical protein
MHLGLLLHLSEACIGGSGCEQLLCCWLHKLTVGKKKDLSFFRFPVDDNEVL